MDKVMIDNAKITNELIARGKTKKWLSLELGRHETFISDMRKRPEQPESVERLICMILGMEPGSMTVNNKTPTGEATILINIHKEILEERTKLEEVAEGIEKIWNKLNVNTMQLERIRDCVKRFEKSGYEIAVEFIKGALADGKVNGEEILMRSDAAGISRADLMKAKNTIGVDTSVTGYGKNQKTWWFLSR